MASEVFEDGIDLQIGLIQAHLPTDPSHAGYPFPALSPTGEQEMRRFRTILLENDYLRATLVPGLGGRILSLFDKRTSREVLARYPALEPQPGSSRGAFLREGISLEYGPEPRANSLGNVDSFLVPTAEEEEPATVWIGEAVSGNGLSFNARWALPPDRAELLLEVRVLNRTFAPVAYSGGLSLHVGDAEARLEPGLLIAYSAARDAGLAVAWEDQPFENVSYSEGTVRVLRRWPGGGLAPRQVDTYQMRLTPFSGIGRLHAASAEAGGSLTESSIRIQSVSRRLGARLFVLTAAGQTLEAPLDLHPETPTEIALTEIPGEVVSFALRDKDKNELLRVERDRPFETLPEVSPNSPLADHEPLGTDRAQLLNQTLHPSLRGAAWIRLAQAAAGESQWVEAAECLDRALLYNADDPLTWWLKAVVERLRGREASEESPELLNAHYLAPMEPALRAEAFLGQAQAMGAEPNALVAALQENPETFIEVACHLLEAGLLMEANRWLDEALRHRNLAMLHVLQAYALLLGTRMSMEVAAHAGKAASADMPPYPFRKMEWVAISALRQAGHPLPGLPETPSPNGP
jgi:tetratricopeptide (TPR) repeat protein